MPNDNLEKIGSSKSVIIVFVQMTAQLHAGAPSFLVIQKVVATAFRYRHFLIILLVR